jgi:hypothetical protein
MRKFFQKSSWQGLAFTVPVTIGIILGSGGDRWIWERISTLTARISDKPKK